MYALLCFYITNISINSPFFKYKKPIGKITKPKSS